MAAIGVRVSLNNWIGCSSMHTTGIPRVVRPGVHVQHFFHARREFGIGLRRDDPVLDLPLRHPVFFSVRRTVSWLTDSTISNATACSASSRSVQLANPSGGAEPQGNDLGLLLAVQHLAADPALRLAVDCDLEPFRHQTFPKPLDRSRSTVDTMLGDPASVVRPVRIRL